MVSNGIMLARKCVSSDSFLLSVCVSMQPSSESVDTLNNKKPCVGVGSQSIVTHVLCNVRSDLVENIAAVFAVLYMSASLILMLLQYRALFLPCRVSSIFLSCLSVLHL